MAADGGFDREAVKPSWVSLSKLDRYRACRRSAWYHYEVKARQSETSSNLVYGSVVHESVEQYLKYGTDPVTVFQERWAEQTASTAIRYGQTMGPDDLKACGELVLKRFTQFWPESGLSVAYGPQGVPLVELDLAADLGDGVKLWGKIDLLAVDTDGRLLILDVKTPAQPCSEIFPMVADQLTDYQVLVEANEGTLKVGPVDGMGYLELVKKKVPKTSRGEGPVVHRSTIAPRRTEGELKNWINKVKGEVRDMRAGRYPRDPGPAYRTMCDGCEFAVHCIHGIEDGLEVPPEKLALFRKGPACD